MSPVGKFFTSVFYCRFRTGIPIFSVVVSIIFASKISGNALNRQKAQCGIDTNVTTFWETLTPLDVVRWARNFQRWLQSWFTLWYKYFFVEIQLEKKMSARHKHIIGMKNHLYILLKNSTLLVIRGESLGGLLIISCLVGILVFVPRKHSRWGSLGVWNGRVVLGTSIPGSVIGLYRPLQWHA